MSGTDFLIQIQQQITGDNPVTELAKTEQALKGAMDSYRDLEKAALQSGKALDRATASVGAVREKMQKAMDAGDVSKFWKLAPALEKAAAKERDLAEAATKAKQALAAQERAVTGLASEFSRLKSVKVPGPGPDTIKTADGLSKLKGPLGAAGGRAKEFGEAWQGLTEQLGVSGAMFAVATVAAIALAAALVAGVVKVASWAIGLADARRETALTVEALYGMTDAANGIQGSFVGITRDTGVASDRLMAMTRELKKAGVQASEVPAALRALAQQESALGDSSGTSALIEDLKSGKKSVAELGKEMQTQFGGLALKRAMGLDAQMTTLKVNVADLFGGSNIEGFLSGLQRLIKLLDSSTESGKAIKAIFDSFLGPLGGTERIFITIERFLLGMIASALRLGIAIKKVASWLGFDTSSLEGLVDAADAGKVALFTLLIPFAPIIVAIGVVVAAVYMLTAAWQSLTSAGETIASAITGAWEKVSTFFAGLDLGQIGADMITGLANGITKNAAKVVQAITGAVGAAIAQAKALRAIRAPSKVVEAIGGQAAAGFVGGVDGGAADAQQSMAEMVSAPEPAVAARSGNGGTSITVGDITIIVQGGSTNEETGASLRAALVAYFEELGLAAGARA